MKTPSSKVGDLVRYEVGSGFQQAEIVKLSGSTHVIVRLLTGPCTGQEHEAPWGIIQPIDGKGPEQP